MIINGPNISKRETTRHYVPPDRGTYYHFRNILLKSKTKSPQKT